MHPAIRGSSRLRRRWRRDRRYDRLAFAFILDRGAARQPPLFSARTLGNGGAWRRGLDAPIRKGLNPKAVRGAQRHPERRDMAHTAVCLDHFGQFENIAAAALRLGGRWGRRFTRLILGDDPANRIQELVHRRFILGLSFGHWKTWEPKLAA